MGEGGGQLEGEVQHCSASTEGLQVEDCWTPLPPEVGSMVELVLYEMVGCCRPRASWPRRRRHPSRSWQELAGAGRSWQELAGAGRSFLRDSTSTLTSGSGCYSGTQEAAGTSLLKKVIKLVSLVG